MNSPIHHQIVIVGGGTAGITVAAQHKRGWGKKVDVAIVEPSSNHYYQPLWTLVGAGLAKKESTRKAESAVIPKKTTWIKDAITEFVPERNLLKTQNGQEITYDFLVVAAGLQVNFGKIPGLKESLGKDGVCSNYSYETVDSTWEAIRNFKGGTALFTNPSGAVKCGGAPQKIMYLADDRFRQAGVREKSHIIYTSALPNIFAVDKYRETLEKVIERKQIECRFREELIEIKPATKEAIVKNLDSGQLSTIRYDLLHVTPPMGSPDFISQSSLADSGGWVDVDSKTLQHTRFPNIFGIGDCSNLPTSKTGAAIRKQAPVVTANLLAAIAKQPLKASYDGYTSCPLVTGIGKLVLAEFNYKKVPEETFPVDQSKERWSMWFLKRYLLPILYWHGMLKGRA